MLDVEANVKDPLPDPSLSAAMEVWSQSLNANSTTQ